MNLNKHLALTAVVVAGAVAGVGAIVGTATAATNPVTYAACESRSTGILYHVTTNATPRCFGRDRTISWGEQGPPGLAGSNGSTVLNGTGTPASSIGQPGDFYLDTAADAIYGPKTATGWPSTGTSLVGKQGPAGQQGPAGPAGPQGPQGASAAGTAVFATPGKYSYTVPDGITNVVVEVQAGGGGGGGQAANAGNPDGAGGGQGGYVKALLPVTGGQTLAVTVGSGGSGGTSGRAYCLSGSRGVNSSVGYANDTQLVQADSGGGGGCAYTGDAGGTAGFGALASPATGISEPTEAAGGAPTTSTGAGGGPAEFAGSGGAGGGALSLSGASGVAGYVVILP